MGLVWYGSRGDAWVSGIIWWAVFLEAHTDDGLEILPAVWLELLVGQREHIMVSLGEVEGGRSRRRRRGRRRLSCHCLDI